MHSRFTGDSLAFTFDPLVDNLAVEGHIVHAVSTLALGEPTKTIMPDGTIAMEVPVAPMDTASGSALLEGITEEAEIGVICDEPLPDRFPMLFFGLEG